MKKRQISLNPLILVFIVSLIFAIPCLATDLQIENVRYFSNTASKANPQVVFDLSWKNSWRNSRNHDAVWVFFKYPDRNFDRHADLAETGHTAINLSGTNSPNAKIEVSADKKGFFIYPAENFRGDINWRLSISLEGKGLDNRFRGSKPKVFGIEMVYIPEGGFTLGDPSPLALNYGSFYRSDSKGEPNGLIKIDSEAEIKVGPNEGALYYRKDTYHGDQTGPIPTTFPKGVKAFYTMKYELTQGQYADFLNAISTRATYERVNFGGRDYFANKGTIRLIDGKYIAEKPSRPMNFMEWDDGLAFADWAALRPMTEFEFTKASRGTREPKPNEFPWGTSDSNQLVRIVDSENNLSFTNVWDESKLSDETLPLIGASFYWVMDLSGSVWERVITIGSPDGRAFKGTHGDGQVAVSTGRATNEDWAHTFEGKEGHGYRGGAFYFQNRSEHEFNPYSPVAYRRFGGWSGAYPHLAYGFRCVRTAEQ